MGAARLAQEGRRFQLSGQYETTPDPTAAIADSVLQLVEIYRAGDYPVALAGFERLRGHPETQSAPGLHLSLLNNIGLCHYKMGDLAAAESTYREILATDSTYVRAHTNLGLVLEATGRPGEAVAHYETALRIDPDNASAQQKLSRLRGTAE